MHITPEAGLEISDENSVTLPRPHNRKRKRMSKGRGSAATPWSEEESFILINVLHDDARKYNFSASTISGPRWKEVFDEFFKSSGKQFDNSEDGLSKKKSEEDRVKSKYQRLKRETKAFKDLLSKSGFGYDHDTETCTCPDDIWEDIVANSSKHVNISKFRYKGLKHFNLLDEIFGKSFATGDIAIFSTFPAFQQQTNDTTMMDRETVQLDDDVDATENVYRPTTMNTGTRTTGSTKRSMFDMSMGTDAAKPARRKKSRETSAEIHERFNNYLEKRMDIIDAKEKRKLEKESTEIDIYSEASAITQLQFLVQNHDLPLDNFSLAVKEFEKESVRKLFVHMHDMFQVRWFNDLGKNWNTK